MGVTTIGPHKIYNGPVVLSHGGRTFGGHYREAPEAQFGIRARAAWASDLLGDVSGAVFVTRGTSAAVYTGIGGTEHLSRDLVTVGLDLGWEPAAVRGSWGSFRVPFGPSLLWNSLDLSSGHRNAYAAPDEFDAPDVEWSDRHWIAYGGYGGAALTVMLNEHLGVTGEGLGRFFYSDDGAWSGQEEDDIRDSTGNTVVIGYERRVVFLWSTELGLEWRF